MRQLKITKSKNNSGSQSLEKYIQETGKVELMSPEEEVKELGTIKDQTLPGKPIIDIVKKCIQRNASVNTIAWAILGGKEMLPEEPVSGFEYISASLAGLTKHSVIYLAEIINVSIKDMARLLNVSVTTLSLKKITDILDPLTSSLLIEITLTIAKGLSVFEDINKFNHWLFNKNKALQEKKPFELLNTPTGIKMVSRVLGRIEEGVYT